MLNHLAGLMQQGQVPLQPLLSGWLTPHSMGLALVLPGGSQRPSHPRNWWGLARPPSLSPKLSTETLDGSGGHICGCPEAHPVALAGSVLR